MSAKDVSRFLLQPEKRYTGVRMQQGRVLLDADFNEAERLDGEEERRTLLDILCSKGTPNRGFLVGTPEAEAVETPGPNGITVPSYDFALAEGSFYLGGLRFEASSEHPDTFLSQSDWLQVDADPANLPAQPTVADLTDDNGNALERHDLVYLRGWEQCVTAVEDREIREAALGGPDTSVRIRRMRRIEVLPDTEATCDAAFDALVDALTAPQEGDGTDEAHALDPESCELRSKARLTIGFGEGEPEDPCQPRVTQGFLGAENQTIRVQLTATDRFIWGYDNASPLYRVRVLEQDGELVKIVFLTEPRDQESQPLQGQAVEILPWGALLPNREKVAELQGHLATVEQTYDPDDPDGPSIVISTAVPSAWTAWLAAHPEYHSERDAEGRREYLYLRLWTGGSGDADQPDHAMSPGTAVSLGDTGLTATFSDFGLPGDHWIIAARPNAPAEVVPWELLEEAAPVGNRFYLAPLALIRWSVSAIGGDAVVIGEVRDCRARFRPLCASGCCCDAFTVGDGERSRGDFQSVQEAIDHLPAEGGIVSLLPGIHRVAARIERRRNITIHGCGKQTLVLPSAAAPAAPIFHVVDSECIEIREMDMVHLAGTAVFAEGSTVEALRDVEVAHTRIVAFTTAVRIELGQNVEIHHNLIRMVDRPGAGVAIFAVAEDSRIERNDIGVRPARRPPPGGDPDGDPDPDPDDPCDDPEDIYRRPRVLLLYLQQVFQVLVALFPQDPFRALGGIHLGGGCERVDVLENRVRGGAGNGVLLGGDSIGAAPEPDGGGQEAVVVTFDLPEDRVLIVGTVRVDGQSTAGIGVAFVGNGGATASIVTDAAGEYLTKAKPQTYTVDLLSPDLRIVGADIDLPEDRPIDEWPAVLTDRRSIIVDLDLERVAPEREELPGFLFDIQIDRNDIAGMGLSGIGVPFPEGRDATPATTGISPSQAVRALLGTPVIGLGIHRNHIAHCFRNAFDAELQNVTRTLGLGGISLRVCEQVRISGNRIESNGSHDLRPACGIFTGFGAEMEIVDNRIVDNAGTPANDEQAPLPGVRGGIAVIAAAVGLTRLLESVLGRRERLPGGAGCPAARVHDNVVKQPVGQSVRLLTIGPASVCNNRLATARAGVERFDLIAGAELILATRIATIPRGGALVHHGNQVELGEEGLCLTAQAMLATDDVGYGDNQSLALQPGVRVNDNIAFFVHALLIGDTIRAIDNRFMEHDDEPSPLASLFTRSITFNNTSSNQADHCIFHTNQDAGRPPFTAGNQVIDDDLCPRNQFSFDRASDRVVFFRAVGS
jgi:hypothetical protein